MPLTIALLHYAAPPTVGGVEATIAAHARVMIGAGHHVRVVAGRAGPLPPAEVYADPLLDSRGPELEDAADELAAGAPGPAFETLVGRLAERLTAALAGCDVAIVHNALTLHKNLALTAALHRLHSAGLAPHLIAWCHDFAWRDPLYVADLRPTYPWTLLRRPWPGVRYVVVSADRRGDLAALLGLPADQIAVVTPGVDPAAFLKLERETVELARRLDLVAADPLLLLPARVTRRKNIELAVATTGALRRRGLRPKLVVTGPPGPHNPTNAAYLAQLQQLRHESGADDAVVFLSEQHVDQQGRPLPVPDALVADLYKLADALLFPSRYEGFGMPIVEAGLAGLPIFCSDIAPFRETAGAAARYFAPDADPAAVAALIADSLAADARAQLRRRARLTYSWDAIYQRAIVPLLAEARGEGEKGAET